MDAIVDSIAVRNEDVIINVIKYHVYWPGTDPFYTFNPTESRARITYYGVNGVPAEFLDGTEVSISSEAGLMGDIVDRLKVPSPLEVTVTDTLVGSYMQVHARVIGVGDLAAKSTFNFQCAAVEWRRPYGGSKHMYIMRDMVPDAAGESFTISKGDTVDFYRSWYMSGTYIPDKMNTLVFVQNNTTHEIIESASAKPPPNHFLWLMAGNKNDIIPEGGSTAFSATAYNFGTVADTFDLDFTKTAPPEWSVSYTTSQGTFTGPSQIVLDPDEEEAISVDVDPVNVPGFARILLSADGWAGIYAVTREAWFQAIHNVQVLLVDDDGGETFETYFEAAMDSTGISWGTWDRAGEPLVLSEVSGYDAMVWWTGLANPSFNGNDRTLIGGYLDGGGNLFATGQDLGFSMCDIGSSYYSAAAEAWYQQYLHATYVGDDTDDLTLVGVASDPISDGMSLNISGGDGANNQEFPDEVDPIEPAKTFFYYNTNIDGAVRYDPGTYKTAYLAFGFEAISTPANRELLMQRVMDWFGVVPTTDVASDAGASRVAYMTQNAPNPFNPDTEIRFSLPVSGPVRLAVYNVEGRLVRTLEDGVRTAGVHTVHWDGMDGNGQAVASGMYLYRIDAGSLCETKKMVLLR